MNKQELIDYCNAIKENKNQIINCIDVNRIIKKIEQLDEPQPIKLKDVIARIEKFDLATKAVWINEILYKLGSDYGLHKYYAGYKQGKFDGSMEREKVTVPQFVADWIEKNRGSLFGLNYDSVPSEIYDWVYEEEGNLKKIHLACAIGYTVEKEKRYLVKFIGVGKLYECLNFDVTNKRWIFFDCDNTDKYRT